MRNSAARPARTTTRSSEQARSPNTAAASVFLESGRMVWTKELERRRQAVNRWRGTDQVDSRREEHSVE